MTSATLDTSSYTLQIPQADRSFFLSLVKKMGWSAKKAKDDHKIPAETLSAIEEARSGKDAGEVDMESLDSFIKSMQ